MEKVSPDGKITKHILIAGKLGIKPNENSKCTINITDCSYLDNITNTVVTIGDIDGDLWRSIELCLMSMYVGEKSSFLILDSNENVSLVIEMLELEFDGYIYEWSADKKIGLAMHHKNAGNQFFKANNNKDAAFRFIKGLKLLHSIPLDVELKNASVEDILVSDINRYKETLYNNLSSCYLKNKNWLKVIDLSLKVLSYNSCNIKALYKLGVAYENENNFEKSVDIFTTLIELEPENKACTEHLAHGKKELNKANIRVNNMIKKMFSN